MKNAINKISIPIIILLITSNCLGCKQKTDREVKPISGNQTEIKLPPLPVQQQAYLFENVELIDYIFNDLPYSMSQNDRPSIQTKIAGISQEGVTSYDCSPMARVFFQIKGEIMLEADVYFSPPECHFYMFFEDGQAVYANQMSESNIAFYTQFLNRMNAGQ